MARLTDEQKAEERAWNTYRKWGKPGTKKRAAANFQKMVRYESANLETGIVQCVTCDFSNHWKNSDNKMHAGHYIGGRTHALLFVEETPEIAANCHSQCSQCNDTAKKGGNLAVYTPWMIERYGAARVEALRKLKFSKLVYTVIELNDLRLAFHERVKAAKRKLESLGV